MFQAIEQITNESYNEVTPSSYQTPGLVDAFGTARQLHWLRNRVEVERWVHVYHRDVVVLVVGVVFLVKNHTRDVVDGAAVIVIVRPAADGYVLGGGVDEAATVRENVRQTRGFGLRSSFTHGTTQCAAVNAQCFERILAPHACSPFTMNDNCYGQLFHQSGARLCSYLIISGGR